MDDRLNLHIRYVMLINIHFIYQYKYVHIYCSLFYSNIEKKIQMNTEFKRKNLYKLWARRKDEHSNIKREYVSDSIIGMYGYFCCYLKI